MKVIVAGLSKTGTTTMNAALTMLGYSVYDYTENVYWLREDYKRIFRDGWTTDDFKRMYKDVDAIVDVPACYFWEEIHKAFPEAKIILTMRENEDVWFESMKKQIEVIEGNPMLKALEFLSPTQIRAMNDVGYDMGPIIWGIARGSRWRRKVYLNEAMMKLKYRAHNAYVLQNAPKDKLLVYQCSEGWGKLCDFLGVPVPDDEFPHENVKGNVVQKVLKINPVFIQMQKEVMISGAILALTLGLGSFFVITTGPKKICGYFTEAVTSVFQRTWSCCK